MTETIKTSVGEITISQTAPGIVEIRLASSEAHPGNVAVVVTNDRNNDTAKLLWIK